MANDFTDDAVEFRSAKRGPGVIEWLAGRLKSDAKINYGASVLLFGCGVTATLMTFLLSWGVLAAFGSLIGLPGWLTAILAVGLVAGLFVLQRLHDGDHREPVAVDLAARGRVTLRVSRLTGNSWLLMLDRPSLDLNPVARTVLNLAFLAPRLFAIGRKLWGRGGLARTLDVPTTASALDSMMQAGRRVDVAALLDEFSSHDPQKVLDDLTAIEGVIYLAGDPPGLTLSPSFVEDYDSWKKAVRKKRRNSA